MRDGVQTILYIQSSPGSDSADNSIAIIAPLFPPRNFARYRCPTYLLQSAIVSFICAIFGRMQFINFKRRFKSN